MLSTMEYFGKAYGMIAADKILNAQEAARLMGAHVETIRRMARKGKIPAFKVGKDWRFRQSSLLIWSETNPGIPKKIHLLSIDDDASVRKQIHQCFDAQRYEVTTVKNGSEGLKQIELGSFDCVLLDLAMSDMSGSAFISQMRKIYADTPVIIITEYPDSNLMMEASRSGPLMLVPKPIQKEMLLSAVNLTLKGALSDTEST